MSTSAKTIIITKKSFVQIISSHDGYIGDTGIKTLHGLKHLSTDKYFMKHYIKKVDHMKMLTDKEILNLQNEVKKEHENDYLAHLLFQRRYPGLSGVLKGDIHLAINNSAVIYKRKPTDLLTDYTYTVDTVDNCFSVAYRRLKGRHITSYNTFKLDNLPTAWEFFKKCGGFNPYECNIAHVPKEERQMYIDLCERHKNVHG